MYQPITDDNTISLDQIARRGSSHPPQLHLGRLVCLIDQTDQVEKQSVLMIHG